MSCGSKVPEGLIGQDVVIDTSGQFVYLGRLTGADDAFFHLEAVDVHDNGDSHTPKEIYIMDARKHGIKKNRTSVYVLATNVTSISRLDDVIEY